jgi:predicted nucleic acid-binding protein
MKIRPASKVALDTSVIIAGLVESHVHFERAAPWLDALADRRITAAWTVHAYAEAWSVLTRLPLVEQLAPEEASKILDELSVLCPPIPLTPADYRAAADRCAAVRVRSGAIFDALHLIAAENSGATVILTFNERDFSRLAPRIAVMAPGVGDAPGG